MHPRSLRVLAALFAASSFSLPIALGAVSCVRQAARLADMPVPVPLDWLLRAASVPYLHALSQSALGAGLLYALTRLAHGRGLAFRNSPAMAAATFVIPVVNWFGPYRHLRALADGSARLGQPSRAMGVVSTAQILCLIHPLLFVAGFFLPTIFVAMAGVTVAWALAWALAAVRIADALEALPVRDTPEYFEGVADVSLPAPTGA